MVSYGYQKYKLPKQAQPMPGLGDCQKRLTSVHAISQPKQHCEVHISIYLCTS